MAIDQRDWYVKKLRKRLRYKERARFRVNLGRQQRARDWRTFWLTAMAIAAGIVAAMYALRAWIS